MNKEIFKIENYDKFKCIADKCKFTCCSGWDVNIDNNTYIKWKSNEKNHLLKNIMIMKNDDEVDYFVNKETHEVCPFLDNKGLCNIVKSDGEEYLSLTCRSFPRIENTFEDKKEFTLSCACPEVVDIISKLSGKIKMISNSDETVDKELRIRELLIDIIQDEKISLDNKLIICFEILSNMLNNDYTNENEFLKKYRNEEYINEFIRLNKNVVINIDEAMEELNYLFLDITENYKDVSGLESSLKEICNYSENIKIRKINDKWEEYKKLFREYDNLIENCIVSKVLSGCISEEIEDVMINFQLIILEYILMRYAVFLKYYIKGENLIDIEDIKDYIVIFSRVISNNSDAVLEFLEDGFGDTILDIGYIRLIMI